MKWFRRSADGLQVELAAGDALAGLASSGRQLILFDGYCGLCSFWVDFVLARDRRGRFVFAPLQSPVGQRVLRCAGPSAQLSDSIALYRGGYLDWRSTAILRILGGLDWPWRTAIVFLAVPAAWRDFVYDVVARYRYEWFGMRQFCRVPTPAERSRFV